MFDSIILDVVIGLTFVFFVFSLLASGINELVRKALNTRAKALWKSIGQILDEGTDVFRTSTPAVSLGPAPKRTASPSGSESLAVQLHEHPLIKSLDPARRGKQTRIHHIPNREFARAVVDLLTPRDGGEVTPQWTKIGDEIAKLPEGLRNQFQVLYKEAGEDVVKFRDAIEGWFDTRMEQVSDWYKKRTRWALAAYGIVIAGFFNVSAIGVTAELYENDVVRGSLVALAEKTPDSFDDVTACTNRECVEEEVGAVVDTGLPIWWRDCPVANSTATKTCGFEDGGQVITSLAGWAITAAALAMGASFWFATLKRAVGLRKSEKA